MELYICECITEVSLICLHSSLSWVEAAALLPAYVALGDAGNSNDRAVPAKGSLPELSVPQFTLTPGFTQRKYAALPAGSHFLSRLTFPVTCFTFRLHPLLNTHFFDPF